MTLKNKNFPENEGRRGRIYLPVEAATILSLEKGVVGWHLDQMRARSLAHCYRIYVLLLAINTLPS